MSLTVEIKLTPPAEEVAARVAGFPQRMLAALAPVVNLEHELTIGHIQSARLSQRGSDTLGVRTGRLRGSIRRREATVAGTTLVSAIGSNVRYLGVHEFGFSGTVTVKAHQRRFANVAARSASGATLRRSISLREASSLRRTKKKKVEVNFHEGVSQVKQHTRRMEFPARAPVRRGIEDRAAQYREAMSAAILKEWQRP